MRQMTYGDGNAIILLVAEKMELAPGLIDDAKTQLDGGAIYPIQAAAIEREAIRITDSIRHDPALVDAANAYARELKIQYGFLAQGL